MRTAEQVLGAIRERGRRGLPLEDIYRQLYNRNLYLLAYGRIYRNQGAMTPGVTEETVDGMSREKIDSLIELLRYERYRWTPVRRVYIEKKNSKKLRPLGIPPWSDKLLQEVIRLILDAYYDPQFSEHSHGFRPSKGCHTALREIQEHWLGTVWFIEGDISQCFDRLDHGVLMSILSEKLHDNRFLRLIENLLKAGYVEDWKFNATLSGTPQGGVVSPILSNIYLDRMDRYVETMLIPEHTRGRRRKTNAEYRQLNKQALKLEKQGSHEEARAIRKETRQMPSVDTNDPDFRRLKYARYADDFLLGFIGPRAEAEMIKQKLAGFLRDELKLELSDQKTLITHARTEAAQFLGYEVHVIHADNKLTRKRRSINGRIGLRVPATVVRAKCQPYMRNGKPIHLRERQHDTDFSIVEQYQQEFRGIAQYYQLAYNVCNLDHLKWVMETSLTKTLAAKHTTSKHRVSVNKVYEKYQTTIQTPEGPYKVLQVVVERTGKKPLVAQWGGIPLRRNRDAVLNDQPTNHWNKGTELLERLLANECELCGSSENIQVHHVRALKDLQRKGRGEKPEWVKKMAARCRKTLAVCQRCHDDIHGGRQNALAR